MRKFIAMMIMALMLLCCANPVFAADGKVTYTGNAGNVVFEPGTEHSLTDLFPNFKGVMPGDTLVQKILVKNNADDKIKVRIYIRSLGAHADSVDFLSQLELKVQRSEENGMGYMFEAAADQTAQLTDWVCLGTLYSGGEVNLDVILHVPVEMGNEFQEQIGFFDWEFRIDELPAGPDDPKPPQTGDTTDLAPWILLMALSGVLMIILILFGRKKKTKEEPENHTNKEEE